MYENQDISDAQAFDNDASHFKVRGARWVVPRPWRFTTIPVLGELGNKGLPGVKKGTSASAPAGARYPAHVACKMYESILAGWIPPEYRVPPQ